MSELASVFAREISLWPDKAVSASFAANMNIFFITSNGEIIDTNLFSKGVDAPPFSVSKEDWKMEKERLDFSIRRPSNSTTCNIEKKTFTEADIRAAFAAGANWVRGGIEEGAAEYVNKLKGDA